MNGEDRPRGPASDQHTSTVDVASDVAAEAQLIAIVGDDTTALVEIRYRRPGGPMLRVFLPASRTRAIITGAHELAASGHDVYVGAAPRTKRSGGIDALEHGHVLWADLDTPESVRRVKCFEVPPSILIRSGSVTDGVPHLLAIWALSEPLKPEHLSRGARRLAHHLGGDMNSTDAARILRIAGTANWKTDPPQPVDCEQLLLRSYHPREIVGGLADPPDRRTPPPAGARRDTTPDGPPSAVHDIPATEYVPRLTGRQVSRDGKAQCPFHAGGNERTPSLHCYPDPERGWYCHGACQQGGDIITLASLLWSIDPKGRGYWDITRRLEQEFGMAAAA